MNANIDDIIERYVAMWQEADAQIRRERIAALWHDECAHYTPSMEVHGHAAMEQRVTTAWEKWVRDSGHHFRSCGDTDGHHGGIRFHWEMVTAAGEVSSLGFDFLRIAADGRIASDHQFLEPVARKG